MIRDDLLTRHFPDIGIQEMPGVLCQVADGRRSGNHSCVLKEQASISGARAAREAGNIVLVLWEMPDGAFVGNRVERLEVVSGISEASRRNGSGTPAWRISKLGLISLDVLIDELLAR